jgi:hypothetical protein
VPLAVRHALAGRDSKPAARAAHSTSSSGGRRTVAATGLTPDVRRRFLVAIEYGALTCAYVDQLAKDCAGQAELLAAAAAHAKRQRSKREGTPAAYAERQHEWLTRMSGVLTQLARTRRIIQSAAFADPLLGAVDVSAEETNYDHLVANLRTLREQMPRRRRRGN